MKKVVAAIQFIGVFLPPIFFDFLVMFKLLVRVNLTNSYGFASNCNKFCPIFLSNCISLLKVASYSSSQIIQEEKIKGREINF